MIARQQEARSKLPPPPQPEGAGVFAGADSFFSVASLVSSGGSTMTEAEQNQLLNQMNDISQMRVNLYQSLSGMNSMFQNALLNSRETLDEQIVAIQIVENQLNDAKAKLKALEEEKNNNIRNIQINDYYSERFNQHAKLMKIFITKNNIEKTE